MKISDLKLRKNKAKHRVARGISAGQGKTAGRGTKGYGSRTGSTRKPGFEGGQNPLMQRIPKVRGFKSKIAKAELVYTGQLDTMGVVVDNFTLCEAGITSSPYVRVKLVVRGAEVSKKHTISIQEASATAIALVEKAGGNFNKPLD
jgi:large subunit ribosomal protein L15